MDFLPKIQEKFNGVVMDEATHTYSWNGKKLKGSVSSKLKAYCKPFDVYGMAPHSARKEGCTVEEILKRWQDKGDESRVRGHRVHTFGELYAMNRSISASCPQERALVSFFDSLPPWIIVIAVEVKMVHHQLKFPGTMDLLLFDIKNNHFIIADYKTNEDLFKNYKGQTLLYPFHHLLDSPFNKYQLQLSFYQILFEQTGFNVGRRVLVWLKMDGSFDAWDTADFTHQLKIDLKLIA